MDASAVTLIQQVYAANPKTIVVLLSSFPYIMTYVVDSIPAIVHITHCSQETGNVLAAVLFGDYNPAGRLTQTWPASMSQLPTMMDYDIRDGRTYMYPNGVPQYPFGYGLSYTTFSYANLTTSADNLCTGTSPLNVSVNVTNTGARDGEEVVQLYVKYPGSAVSRPSKQLRGFNRVPIAAGATSTVTIPLLWQDLAYWDSTQSVWTVENGNVQILVGGSSADSALTLNKTISVCAGTVSISQDKPVTTGRAASSIAYPMAIVRHGASVGIALSLWRGADFDISVFDLRGVHVGRVSGKSASNGYTFLPLGSARLGAGLYMISARISGKEYSTLCIVK
jgi:hypothetical protein